MVHQIILCSVAVLVLANSNQIKKFCEKSVRVDLAEISINGQTLKLPEPGMKLVYP